MEAIRETADVTNHVVTLRLPDSFTARRVEVIVLALADEPASTPATRPRRSPSPALAGTVLLDDFAKPVLPEADWDALQ